MKRSQIFILLCILTGISQAWTYKGNGGYSVVCPNSAELLDYYEGRVIRNFRLKMGNDNLSVGEKVDLLLKRLAVYSPQRSARYRQQAADFQKEARFLVNVDLGEIGDADPIVVPAGCKPIPTINQRVPEFPGDPRYIVKQEIWDRLDNNSKAGLILHELIYRELQQDTSINTRYFNSLLASDQFETLSPKAYLDLSERVGFKSENIQGLEVDLTAPYTFFPNGNLNFARPVADSFLTLQGQQIYPLFGSDVSFYSNGRIHTLSTNTGFLVDSLKTKIFGDLVWNEQGQILSGELQPTNAQPLFLQSAQWPQQGFRIELGRDWDLALRSCKVTFYPSGKIKSATPTRGDIWLEGQKHVMTRRDPTEFYESGSAKTIYLAEPMNITMNGKQWTFLKSRDIQLAENGQILCGTISSRTFPNEKMLCRTSTPTSH